MTSHFERWANAYHHFIDEWYGKFILLFNLHGYYGSENVPSRSEFYQHCYKNTRCYWDKNKKRKVPSIVFTPRAEEEQMQYEEYYLQEIQNYQSNQ